MGNGLSASIQPPKIHSKLGFTQPIFRSGDIYVAPSEATPGRFIFPLSYPMGELYMMSLLGTGLGMLFHAAGVINQGKGYLFAGQGTAGKTTIARLWQGLPGVQVVNDDKVIVRKEAGCSSSTVLPGTGRAAWLYRIPPLSNRCLF